MLYELSVQMTPPVARMPESLEKQVHETCDRAGHSLITAIRTLLACQGGLKKARVSFVLRHYDEEQIVGALAAKLAHKNIEPEQMDDVVHDAAAHAASTVNNQGLEGQIRFLLQELGLEETVKIVDDVLTGGKDDDNERSDRSDPPAEASGVEC